MGRSLPPRLKVIADSVSSSGIVADVGTDHGYLPVYLIREKGLQKVIATDVNKDPLAKAQRIIFRHKLTDQIELRLGDGLKVLEPGEADTIILAGMGGILISDLLDSSPEVAKSAKMLIAQPIQAVSGLRQYLWQSGYRICSEKLVQEKHRFYETVFACYEGNDEVKTDPVDLEIGTFIREQAPGTAKAYLKRKIRILEQRQKGLREAKNLDTAAIKEIEGILKALKEELSWFGQ